MAEDSRVSRFRDVGTDIAHARELPDTPQARSPSYRLAFADPDFLTRDDMRGVRLQLELMKPELTLAERGIVSTVVLFGGARVPAPGTQPRVPGLAALAPWYEVARSFARGVGARCAASGCHELVVATGGGPGVMEAGNRGAAEAGAPSIGLNIVLPHEQRPNDWVTPELTFNFHYFAIRKMHFLMRARAVAVFPGGFGTLDEMFESLTLIQTGRMARIPLILFGRDWWHRLIDWEMLAEAGTIARTDLELLSFADTAEEGLAVLDAAMAG